MSATQHSSTKDHSARRNFSLVAAVLTASTLALGGSALTAAPAHALTRDGCTINPLKPKLVHDKQKVRYSVKIFCSPDSTVKVYSQPWEQDPAPNPDDKLGHEEVIERHIPSTTTVIVHYDRWVPNTEGGHNRDEEVYHHVRFQVRPSGHWIYKPIRSAGNSPVLTIHQ